MPKKRTQAAKDRVFSRVLESTPTEAGPHPIHVYKVALRYQPDIWRRIEIPGEFTLHDLHDAIFDAYDRDDEHLYAFYLQPAGSRRVRPRTDADTFIHPYAFDSSEERTWSADAVKLNDLHLRPNRKLMYEFDFGDQWWHVVTFERTVPKTPRAKYPRVVEKKGKSPPQYPDWED